MKQRGARLVSNHPYLRVLVLLALIALCAAAVLFGIGLCTGVGGGQRHPVHDSDKAAYTDMSPAAHARPYDWTHLYANDGKYSYEAEGRRLSRFGIDVSAYQGEVDWKAAASDGVEFAMIRVGYRDAATGGLVLDERFADNLAKAQAAGVDCGVYFFSQAASVEEAQEEADFVLSHLADSPLEYPVAFDSEKVEGSMRTSELTNDEMTDIARAFCERIAGAGYTPMVYGNSTDMARYDLDALSSYGRWFAGYDTVPYADFDFALWQYSESGSVAGIDGAVDFDLDLTGAW